MLNYTNTPNQVCNRTEFPTLIAGLCWFIIPAYAEVKSKTNSVTHDHQFDTIRKDYIIVCATFIADTYMTNKLLIICNSFLISVKFLIGNITLRIHLPVVTSYYVLLFAANHIPFKNVLCPLFYSLVTFSAFLTNTVYYFYSWC